MASNNKRIQVHSPKGIQSPLFSQAIVHNGLVYLSGNIGLDYTTMTPVGVTAGEHTRQTLLNMQTVLTEAGSSLQKIIKATVFLTDMADFAAMNKVWMELVGEPRPARTCVAVRELPFGTDVEIECIAHLN